MMVTMDELKHSQVTVAERSSSKYTPEECREIHRKALAMLAWGSLPLKSRDDAHQLKVNDPIEDVDRLIGALSLVVLEARSFSRENKRRLAQFIFAAGEMISERTRLDAADQNVFEAALR